MAKDVLLSKQHVVDEIINEVSRILGEDVTVTPTNVTKTNVVKTGIILKAEGCNIAPTIYLESFVDRINEDESNVSEVAQAIVDTYYRSKIDKDYDASWFMDFEGQVKDRLRMKLINTEWNQEILKDVPSVPFLDLSIVFYCIVPDMDEQGSILIHNSHLDFWNRSVDTIFKAATENTVKAGYEIRSIMAVLREMMGVDELPFEEQADDMMYVLTNKSKFNGSVLFTMENILADFVKEQEKLRGKKIDSVIVIPSSLHESLLICKDDSLPVDEMNISDMIKSINNDASIMNAEDVLSDHAYVYVADEHKIMSIN